LRNDPRLAVRRTGAPLAEIRLRVPSTTAPHTRPAALLAGVRLPAPSGATGSGLPRHCSATGAASASADADRLGFGGSALTTRLPDLLDLLAEALTSAAYPARDVARERDRLVERLTIARAQPGVLAHEALERRMWGEHPYARDLARPEAVSRVTAAQLRALHDERMAPRGASLVVVGSLAPEKALDEVRAGARRMAWPAHLGPCPAAHSPGLAGATAGPAGLGPVGHPARRPGPAARTPRRAGTARREPGVRWQLLVTVGEQHP
jgi:hypothetical protein